MASRFACALTLATPALAEDLGGADLTAPPVTSAEALPATLSGTLAKIRASGIITLGYRDASFPFSYVRPARPSRWAIPSTSARASRPK